MAELIAAQELINRYPESAPEMANANMPYPTFGGEALALLALARGVEFPITSRTQNRTRSQRCAVSCSPSRRGTTAFAVADESDSVRLPALAPLHQKEHVS